RSRCTLLTLTHLPTPLCPSAASPPPSPPTLSLHDALPIFHGWRRATHRLGPDRRERRVSPDGQASRLEHHLRRQAIRAARVGPRSEEHTSELQSRGQLVCRLLLEKKNIDSDQREVLMMRIF